jgi:hypothetical protein
MSYGDDGVVLALCSLGVLSVAGLVRGRLGSNVFDLGAALEAPEEGAPAEQLWIGRAIRREGKLGGTGYTGRPWSERKPILDACVQQYGYRSCLGSIQVLLNLGTAGRTATDVLEHDKEYLVTTYGGSGTFGPRGRGKGSRARGREFDLEAQLGLSSPAKGRKFVYEVHGVEKKALTFDSKEKLLARFEQKGVIKPIKGEMIPYNPALLGQPYLKGLIGPMIDKETRDKVVLRYETQNLYDMNWP